MVSVGGPFSLTGGDSTKHARNVRYVPIPREHMLFLHDCYTRGDALITRANAIRSEQAFGQGYFLEWAQEEKILPTDVHDYTAGIQTLLEKARQWRDMFGFVGFVRPNDLARGELRRQRRQDDSPEAVAREQIADDLRHLQSYADGERFAKKRKRGKVEGGVTSAKAAVIAKESPKPEAMEARLERVSSALATLKRNDDADVERALTLMDMLFTIEDVQIVPVDAGQFYVQIDDMTLRQRVVWVPNSRLATTSPGIQNHIQFDTNVTVYTWPGREPTRDGIITTDFMEIFRLREMVYEAHDAAMDANYQCAHPTPIFERVEATGKVDPLELPEEDLFGIAMFNQGKPAGMSLNIDKMTPGEIQTYKRDTRQSILFNMLIEAGQDEAMRKRVEKIAAGSARATRATRGGLTVDVARSTIFDSGGTLPLPSGMKYAGFVQPSTLVETQELRNNYTEQLCVALGVPMSYLKGEQAGRNAQTSVAKAGGTTSTSTTQTESMMRTTVIRDRDDLSRFFAFLYDSLFREADDEALAAQLKKTFAAKAEIDEAREALVRAARDSFDVAVDIASMDDTIESLLSEAARISMIEHKLRRVIGMSTRLALKFVKAPFADIDTLQKMHEFGALSHADAANIMRTNAGLEKLEEADFKAISKERLKDTRDRVAAEQPPPQPGAGAAKKK